MFPTAHLEVFSDLNDPNELEKLVAYNILRSNPIKSTKIKTG